MLPHNTHPYALLDRHSNSRVYVLGALGRAHVDCQGASRVTGQCRIVLESIAGAVLRGRGGPAAFEQQRYGSNWVVCPVVELQEIWG